MVTGTMEGAEPAAWPSRAKWTAFLVALAILFDGFDNLLLGTIIPSLMAEWKLSRGELMPVVAVSIVGMSLGTAVMGVLGDRLGRWRTLIICVALFGAGTLLCTLASSLLQFGVFRVVCSIGLGGLFPNAVALVFEVTPSRHRNTVVSLNQTCVPAGGMLGSLLAAALLSTHGWRPVTAVGGGAAILLAFVLWAALPETPAGTAPAASRRGLRELLERPLRGESIALWVTLFCNYLCIYGMFNWGPTLIVAAHFTLPQMALSLSAFNLGSILGAGGGGWLMDRLGSRRPMLLCAWLAAALAAGLAFGGWPWLQTAPLLCGMFALGLLVCGLQAMLYALAAAIYPAHLRASGVGTATGIGRLGALASTFVGANLLSVELAGFLAVVAIAMSLAASALLSMRRHSAPAI